MSVLPSCAFDETLAFYGAAGFALVARDEAEGYRIVRRRRWRPMDRRPTAIPRLRDDGDADDGRREFHVVDPSGSLLRVGAPVGSA